MMRARKQKIFSSWPWAAGLFFALGAAPLAFADGEHEVRVAAPAAPAAAPGGNAPANAPQAKDDNGSMLRDYMWEGSFDKAGDATYAAEKQLKKGFNVKCDAANAPNLSPAQKQAALNQCEALRREVAEYGEDAASIRATQRVFSDVSKVSDIAAVGAIGATAYAQFGKRDPNQADMLRSAANIQETAGYAAYATGATDFTMGAFAYVAQKQKLDSMQETLKGKITDQGVLSKISAAAEQTKQAAFSHMAIGAGKAALGYASMYLAQQNRKQANSLVSLDEYAALANAATATATATQVAPGLTNPMGGAPSYNNNNPVFSLSDGTSQTAGGTTANKGSPVFSGGASVYPSSPELRGLASSGGLAGGGGGLGGGSAGTLPGGGSGASETPAPEEAKADEAGAGHGAGNGALELGGGGGASRWGGGKGGASTEEAPPPASLLASLGGGPGVPGAGAGSATGINPNEVYRDATDDDAEGAQSSEVGVNSAKHTLFEVVRTRYTKLVRGGRVTGPGAVEVR